MIARGSPLLTELQEALSGAEAEALVRLMRGRDVRDGELAELIEVDARWRLQHGLTVNLERYFGIAPDLESRPISLDAAIEFSLRSLSGGSRPTRPGIEMMIRNHPRLEQSIRNAVALSEGLATTRTLKRIESTGQQRALPCEFGPMLRDGRARYELTERLGGGSQGEVYRAVDRALSEPDRPALAAVKILADTAWSESDRWRAIDEATRARRINHPNVVRVLDRGSTDENEHFVVYEFVDGGDLDGWLNAHNADAPEIAALFSQVARGVQAAHSAGLVHRDLKPANVLLTRGGEPKVADFGVATAADGVEARGDRQGNLAFIAPEQYRGEESGNSATVDVYALGGMLFTALTGRLPNGETAEEVARTHSRDGGRKAAPRVESKLRGFDNDLEAICRRAMAPRPEDRYSSLDAVASDLDAWRRREPLVWTRPTRMHRFRLLIRREPRLVAAIAAAAVALVGGVGGSAYTWARGAAKTEIAEMEAKVNKEFAEREAQRRSMTAKVIIQTKNALIERSEDWFVMLTILESMTGPYFFDPKAAELDVWPMRTRVAMAIIGDYKLKGQPTCLESLMWMDTTAFWYLRSNYYELAEDLLARSDAGWECKLEPNDPWRDVRAGLKAVAAVQRFRAQADSGAITSDLSKLRDAAGALRRVESHMSVGPHDDSLHRFILRALVDAYAPDLLNQPEERAWAVVRAMDVRAAAFEKNPPADPFLTELFTGRPTSTPRSK